MPSVWFRPALSQRLLFKSRSILAHTGPILSVTAPTVPFVASPSISFPLLRPMCGRSNVFFNGGKNCWSKEQIYLVYNIYIYSTVPACVIMFLRSTVIPFLLCLFCRLVGVNFAPSTPQIVRRVGRSVSSHYSRAARNASTLVNN